MGGSLQVLGAVRLTDASDTPVELRGVSQRKLLSALAANSGATVRAEALCEILETSPSALRTAVSRMRSRTGDGVLETDGAGYRLVADLDANRFEHLVSFPGTISTRLETLDAALALWNGDAFEEFSHEPWAQGIAARLNELRHVALDDVAQLLVAQGRAGEAVAALEARVRANPHRDRTQGLLVQALAADGRQAAALQAYQNYRTVLVEESGTEPSAMVQAIERRVAVGIDDEAAIARQQAFDSGLAEESTAAAAQPKAADQQPPPMSDSSEQPSLPSGVLTFLFTDIEESTRRWEQSPVDMRATLALHDDILYTTVPEHDGIAFKHTGDGIGAVFTSPAKAVEAAIAIQRKMQTQAWARDDRLRVRIGLHMGEGTPTGTDYFGTPVNRASRVMDIANGDQILVSAGVAAVLPASFDLTPLGDHLLKGIGTDAIFLIRADDMIVDERPLRSVVSGPRRLPESPDRLVGREIEIDELAGRITEHQCMTLIGPGGVGKTRLALAAGAAVFEDFRDGAAFCDFAALGDEDAVADAVAAAVGARTQPGMSLIESVVDYLSERDMLVILDNCEHVADAARSIGHEILTRTGSKVIATSREPIGLPGEQLFGVQPLVAAPHGVDLFVERAIERNHSFKPTADELSVIEQICARVDGIPLAIELAAAWVRVLAPAQILERLEDRFRFLRGGRPGGRHETLRDTILWSYEQLDERQARLFDRLSVFAGGFSLEAVEAVCADELIDEFDVLELLMALVDKSMVVAVPGVGHVRFTMLGTLRQFAQEQLDANDQSERYRSRHAEFFRDFTVAEASMLISAREADVWELLNLEWSNVRVAFETLRASDDLESASTMVLELGWFATLSMRFELYGWLEELFDSGIEATASLLGLKAVGAYFTVDADAAMYAQKGLELDPNDPHCYCRVALCAISLNNELSGHISAPLTTEWLDSLTRDSPVAGVMWAEGMRAFHLCVNEASPDAATHAQRLRDLADRTGSATASGVAYWASGMVASFQGVDAALDEWREGLDVVRSLAPVHLVNDLIIGLILHFTVSRGDLDEVIVGSLDALENAHSNHYSAGTSHLFGVTAIVLTRAGRIETAARLLGAMTANGHVPRGNASHTVNKVLGDEAEQAKALGAGLSINDAATLAINTLREIRQERVAT